MTTTLDDDLLLFDDDNDDFVFDPTIFDEPIPSPIYSSPIPSPIYSSPSPSIPSPIYSSPSPEIEIPIIPQPILAPRKSPRKQQPRVQTAEIEDLNKQKTVKKSPNYKIGYEKRKNNKIYVKDIEKYQKIYAKTSSDVFPVYKMLYNEIPLPLDGTNNNISEKYREKIRKDYEENRGNCQTQTEKDLFQTDERGQYIYSDQILRSHSFNAVKGSQARKCFLELDETSTRLLKREKEIFINQKLFILENGDDYELKLWYVERNLENDYQNLKKEWNDWKKQNANTVSKFRINSREMLQVLDREYKNFDDFLKDRWGDDKVKEFREKIKEIYQTDLNFFLQSK
jgi:hypothetical protein